MTRTPATPGPPTTWSTCCSRAPGRRTALDISAAMDAVGGELNAFTAKEYTCYYARVLDADLPLAIDVCRDMVTGSLLEPSEVEAERGVILEEIAMNDDDPADTVHEAFAAGSCSATRRSAGRSSAASTRSTRSPARQIAAHYRPGTRPEHLVVAAAGRRGPRRGGRAHQSGVRAGADRRRAAGAAPAGRRGPDRGALGTGVRLVSRRSSRPTWSSAARPGPDRRPAVRARRAERRARRRHVVPAVPGGPGEAGARLLGLQLHLAARRHRRLGRLRRLPARPRPTRCSAICRGRDREGRRRRADRRRAGPRQGPAARRRSCSGWRTRRRG